MRTPTLLLTLTAGLAIAANATADDDIYKEDGVVCLRSTEPGLPEMFNVYRDGNEIEVEHLIYSDPEWVEINNKDYFISNTDLIRFEGDNDTDVLLVSHFGAEAVEIPVIAYGYSGDDTLYGGAARCILYGGAGADFLVGTDGNDYLDPGEGTASVYGYGGADIFVLWQQYVWNARAEEWERETVTDIVFFDFMYNEGDYALLKIKSKYSNLPITDPPLTKQSSGNASRFLIP